MDKVKNVSHEKQNKDIDKMVLKSRFVCDGKYEVNGVIFYADTHSEAIRKYRRGIEF